jgi:hypothetical protein
LELTNPNQPTTLGFGSQLDELEESVVAAYNHIRMEGSYARVGYGYDICRGDEVWNSSQQWYDHFDDLNAPATEEMTQWVWREWYYTINVCNFILSKTGGDNAAMNEQMRRIKGQALFLRGLSYYNLAGYYQNSPLITDYASYGTLEGLYAKSSSYDELLVQCESDFSEAMTLLPKRDEGGEWAKGRATCGAAAGYYARTLMMRPTKDNLQKALTVLKGIMNKEYGTYKLMANYGDNFREGSAYENNEESLFEVQFLDNGTQGTDQEWTPVNVSSNPTQGHALESNCCPGDFSGWADLSASPWLYNLFLKEKTTEDKLDPRLYWTIGTYEDDWNGFEKGNVCYGKAMTAEIPVQTNNNNGGLPIAKNTNMRTGLYTSVITGLRCGINLRMMRYSDVLLRAAECENEINNGPTDNAINWVNQVRNRAKLKNLKKEDFNYDSFFEQIANVERPKEFGCEFGRGFDLIRWGFFYSADRLQQLKEHGTFRRHNYVTKDIDGNITVNGDIKEEVSYAKIGIDSELKSSYDSYVPGHEFLPIFQGLLNANPNLKGNSANNNTDNGAAHRANGWPIHPVVKL